MKTSASFRSHPVTIIYNMRWGFLLGLIPIFRGVISTLRVDFEFFARGMWVDFVIFALIILFAILKWFCARYTIDQVTITAREGIFFVRETVLPWEKVTVVKTYKPWYLRPIGAELFRADALGGSYKNSDINLCLSNTNSNIFLELYENYGNANVETKSFKPSIPSILYLALVSTNNFVGIFYLSTFITQSGNILGREFPDMLIDNFQSFTKTTQNPLPPAALAITYFLFATWLIGVVFTLFRYYKYTVDCKGNYLTVSGGLIGRQKQVIPLYKANYLSIRQNIVAYFTRFFSLYISAVGCGKERADITCILPSDREDIFLKNYQYIFPERPIASIKTKTALGSIFRFISFPLFLCLFFALSIPVAIHIVPSWQSFITFVGLMLLFPGICLLIVSIADYNTNGIGVSGEYLTIRYARRFNFYTIVVHRSKISKIVLKQSIFQRSSNTVSLKLYTVSESRRKHQCKNLELVLTKELLASLQLV